MGRRTRTGCTFPAAIALALAHCLSLTPGSAVAADPPAEAAQPCPYDFQGYAAIEQIACTCAAGEGQGTVWGTGAYTDDSAICSAAAHAGLIGSYDDLGALSDENTEIIVHGYRGCDSYRGSSRNGVDSEEYGPWDGSFYFPAASLSGCAQSFP